MRNFPAQYNLRNEDVLYFAHIPKTAGMTFRTIVEDHFACAEICPATLNAQVAKIPKTDLQKYRLYRGHLGFIDLPNLLPGKNVVNVTVLREPVARLISHYEYIRRMPGDPHYKYVKDMTLEDFCYNLTAGQVGKNIQTYHVAKAMRFDIDELPPEDVLQLAKTSLDQFGFVGLVERFQDSLFLLSYILGWRPILNNRKENAAKRKTPLDAIPEKTLEVIRASNQLDLELYQYAKEIFEARFDQMLQTLCDRYGNAIDLPSGAVPDLAQTQQLLEQHYHQRYLELQISGKAVAEYRFCDALRGSNWQRRESPENGLAYRWIGPGTVSTLDLPLTADRDLILEFQLLSTQVVAPDVVDSLTVAVNGQAIELSIRHADQDVRQLRGYIPQSLLPADGCYTRLTFSVNRVMPLNYFNPDLPDTRQVGLAVNLVKVFPVGQEQTESIAHHLFSSDPVWKDALEFMQRHLKPGETVIGPAAFDVKLNDERQQIRALDFAALFEGKPYQWAILHKGRTDRMNAMLVQLLLKGFSPVFASEVFVIFTNRKDVPRLSYSDRYIRYLYWGRFKVQFRKKMWMSRMVRENERKQLVSR